MPKQKVLCYKCRYLQIRHTDKVFKYGCRKLGFKSASINWGWLQHPCPLFEEHPLRLKKKKNNNSVRQLDIKNKKEGIDYYI